MKLSIVNRFSFGYIKSLKIVKEEQPEKWEFFCNSVPLFTVVSNYILAALLSSIKYNRMIRRSKVRYLGIWNKDGSRIVQALNTIFGFSIDTKIKAHVCITPLYIRDIEGQYFLVPTNSDENRILEIITHELSHFYFYHCYMSAYDSKRFWYISELIVPKILEKIFGKTITPKSSYVGEPTLEESKHISDWIDKKITFQEFVDLVVKKNEL